MAILSIMLNPLFVLGFFSLGMVTTLHFLSIIQQKVGFILGSDKKAISPVLAVLLMVAIVVAASLITYSWVGSYIVSTTGRAGHAIQIQSVDWTKNKKNLTEVTVYIQNVGEGTVTFTDAYVDGEKIKEKGFGTISEGETATVILKCHKAYSNGQKIHIKIVSEIGIFAEGTYLVEGI